MSRLNRRSNRPRLSGLMTDKPQPLHTVTEHLPRSSGSQAPVASGRSGPPRPRVVPYRNTPLGRRPRGCTSPGLLYPRSWPGLRVLPCPEAYNLSNELIGGMDLDDAGARRHVEAWNRFAGIGVEACRWHAACAVGERRGKLEVSCDDMRLQRVERRARRRAGVVRPASRDLGWSETRGGQSSSSRLRPPAARAPEDLAGPAARATARGFFLSDPPPNFRPVHRRHGAEPPPQRDADHWRAL